MADILTITPGQETRGRVPYFGETVLIEVRAVGDDGNPWPDAAASTLTVSIGFPGVAPLLQFATGDPEVTLTDAGTAHWTITLDDSAYIAALETIREYTVTAWVESSTGFLRAQTGATPVKLAFAEGVPISGAPVVIAPTLIQALPDLTTTVGGGDQTLDLSTYFAGTSPSYSYAPTTTGVTISGASLTLADDAELALTSITVTATNSADSASDSMNVSVAAGATVPGAPTNFTLTDATTGGALDYSFTAPASNGGSPILRYEFTDDAGTTFTDIGLATSGTITGQTDGVAVTAQVRAVNAVGNSALSNSDTATPTTADTTAPTFQSASVENSDPSTVIVTLSEPPAGTTSSGDWTLVGNTITSAAFVNDLVHLGTGTPVVDTDDLTGALAYTGSTITDAAGNALAAFSGADVANNVLPPPVLTGANITDSGGGVGALTVTFDAGETPGDAVRIVGYIDTPADADPTTGAEVAAGTGAEGTFTIDTTVGATNVAIPIVGSLSGTFDVFVAASYDNGTTWSNVVSVIGVEFDTAAPAFLAAEVGNISDTNVRVTFSETLGDETAPGDWSVAGNTVTAAARTADYVDLTLDTPVVQGADLTGALAYSGTTLTDANGNPVQPFTGQDITNNVGPVFVPSDLFASPRSGIVMNIHPDNLFTDTVGGTNAAVGDQPTVAEDLSGNGNGINITGATLRQDGSGAYYLESLAPPNQAIITFDMASPTADMDYFWALDNAKSGPTSKFGLLATSTSGNFIIAHGGNTAAISSNIGTPAFQVSTTSTSTNPTNRDELYVALSAGFKVFEANDMDLSNGEWTTGNEIGGYITGSGFEFQGSIGSVVIVDAMTPTERGQMRSYLWSEYGI